MPGELHLEASLVAVPGTAAGGTGKPKSLPEAARQFEALLIAQLLKEAHGDGEQGWLGTGDDTGDTTAAELAESQFAQALANSGGLGLSKQIVASLAPRAHPL